MNMMGGAPARALAMRQSMQMARDLDRPRAHVARFQFSVGVLGVGSLIGCGAAGLLWLGFLIALALIVIGYFANLTQEVLRETIPASEVEQRKLDWILGPELPALPSSPDYSEPLLTKRAEMKDSRLRCMGCGEPMGDDCHRPAGDTHSTSAAYMGYCGGKLERVRGGSPIDHKLSDMYYASFDDPARAEQYRQWEPCFADRCEDAVVALGDPEQRCVLCGETH